MYRVNTFPLIHQNLLHAFFNILALAPLLERFETEFGTLTSLALFFGRQYNPKAYACCPSRIGES